MNEVVEAIKIVSFIIVPPLFAHTLAMRQALAPKITLMFISYAMLKYYFYMAGL